MENKKQEVITIDNLNDLVKISEILRSLSITLTGELVIDSNEKARALITKENDKLLKNVYKNVGLINDKITDMLSPSSSIESNNTPKKDDIEQGKLFEEESDNKEKNNLKVVHNENSSDKEHTVEQKEEKEDKKEDDNPPEEMKRYNTEEEALDKVREEIISYVSKNKEVVFSNKLPSDVKAAMKLMILKTVPEDSKLAELNDKGKVKDPNLMGNTLSNITGEVLRDIKNQKVTDGKEVANDDNVAEELKKQVVDSVTKNKVEEESRKPEEVEQIETPEDKEEEKSSAEVKNEADHLGVIIESTEKEEIKNSIKELIKTCKNDEETRSLAKNIIEVLKTRIIDDKEEKIKKMFNKNIGKTITRKNNRKEKISYHTNIRDLIIEQKQEIKKAV